MKTSIGYKGNVTITIKNRPVVKKSNSGTMALFHAVSELLTQVQGVSDTALAVRRIPAYMSFLKGDECNAILNDDYKYINYQHKCIVLSELPIVKRSADSTGQIELSAMLNSTNMSSEFDTSGGSEGTLVLLDGVRENILACIKLNLSQFETVQADRYGQATITWKMAFNNVSVN